jgi:uncharacterized protein YggE
MPRIEPNSAVDLIDVSALEKTTIVAYGAKVHIKIRGSSLVSANTAITKAREVAALASQLQNAEIAPEDIEVDDIRVDITNGLLKTSEAVYSLTVTCRRNDLITSVINAISSQKQATLTRIQWQYPGEDAALLKCLELATTRAKQKAAIAATALGTRLVAVHRFYENSQAGDDDDDHLEAYDMAPGMRMRSMQASQVEAGVNMNHTKQVSVLATITFRTEPVEG